MNCAARFLLNFEKYIARYVPLFDVFFFSAKQPKCVLSFSFIGFDLGEISKKSVFFNIPVMPVAEMGGNTTVFLISYSSDVHCCSFSLGNFDQYWCTVWSFFIYRSVPLVVLIRNRLVCFRSPHHG